MDVMWDEESILRKGIQSLLKDFQALLECLEQASLDMIFMVRHQE